MGIAKVLIYIIILGAILNIYVGFASPNLPIIGQTTGDFFDIILGVVMTILGFLALKNVQYLMPPR
ncbi:hypothetical protein J4422_03515 [Candidatus Pacearchaeota archaeon]|nr:hypothetical protein [Candidatus Pacearchaeota archaeon]